MKILILLALLGSVSFAKTPLQISGEIEKEILADGYDMPYTKKLIDQGMNRAIDIAALHLNELGYFDFAEQIQHDWQVTYGSTLFASTKDIGDHAGVFAWVDTIYRRIEAILGRDFCVKTHIAAMLTFNSANVVVKPCSFPMDSVQGERIDEYRRHFAGKSPVSDSNYNGVVPEAIYFAIEIGCLAGTSGSGSGLCGLAASACSRAIAMFVAPRMSDRIYLRACENKEQGDY